MAYEPFVAADPIGMQPAAYSDTGGAYVNQQVFSRLDLYNPYEQVQLVSRHSGRPSSALWMKLHGFASGTNNYKVGHYEVERDETPISFGAVVTPSGGAGNSLVASISADYQYNTGVSVNGNAALGEATPGRVGEHVLLPGGGHARIMDKDTSVVPHQVTLRPVNANDNLDTLLAVDTPYALITNSWGEATGIPRGLTPRVIKYSNDFQIIKEAVAASGSEMTNNAYFQPVPGVEGSIYLRAKWQTMGRFEDAKSRALIFGVPGDNLTMYSDPMRHDVDIRNTEGLLYFARTNGYNDTYDPNNYTVEDFDDYARTFEFERIGVREFCGFIGFDLYTTIENTLNEYINSEHAAQLIQQRVLDGPTDLGDNFQPWSAEDLRVHIGFTSIKKAGFTWTFKIAHEFNDGRVAGLPAYDWSQTGVFFPMGYRLDYEGGRTPVFGYHWKQGGGISRENIIAPINGVGVAGTGGVTPQAAHQYDSQQLAYLTEMASHFTTGNHFLYLTPQ